VLHTAAIALGSNAGDRRGHLDYACSVLRRLLRDCRVSSYRETSPVGVPGPQPLFLNAAAVGRTPVSPHALLDALLRIEQERGRERPFPGAARTLDLDLILFDALVLTEPDLTLPHPRFRDRRFVVEPLAEIAPDLTDPVTGCTIVTLLARLDEKA
jgi:2-amino-4-hydroxy-6-hydroxymethyldihydropteridine diphosphokinase